MVLLDGSGSCFCDVVLVSEFSFGVEMVLTLVRIGRSAVKRWLRSWLAGSRCSVGRGSGGVVVVLYCGGVVRILRWERM